MFPQTPPPVRFKAREKAFYPPFTRCSHLSSSHWLVVIFALAKVITSANQEKDSLRKALKGTKKKKLNHVMKHGKKLAPQQTIGLT